ncbi:hypothetical protein AB0J72_17535 [Dactylosporangium sp. NPDC049742]|uniref:hypothetical protein n=1 Tax=Dactylosporangium sp. NPDC049742 TaxID=3154737 RepID=UPI00343E9D41
MHRISRVLPYAAALSVGLATVVVGAAPASAAQTSLTPTTWAYTEAQQPRTAFVNTAGDLPVGTTTGPDGVTHTRRSYFTYDLTGFKGNSISGASLSALITPDAACAGPVTLELWRTGKLNRTPTWRNAPAELELVRQWTRGCDGWFVDTVITDVITAARARGDRSVTFELRVVQADEGAAGSGFLIGRPQTLVSHNAIPVVRDPGLARDGRCGTLERPRPANLGAEVAVTVTDADPLDFRSVVFAWWPVDAPEQRHVVPAGNDGRVYLMLNGLAEGTVVAWAAQAYDYTDYSAWSKTCYLKIDLTPPATTVLVSSTDFPQDGEPHGELYVPGTFTLDAQGNRDVIGFMYISGSGARNYVYLDQPGGSATVSYAPSDYYPVFEAAPIDMAGNEGTSTYYEFMVNY